MAKEHSPDFCSKHGYSRIDTVFARRLETKVQFLLYISFKVRRAHLSRASSLAYQSIQSELTVLLGDT